MAESSYKSSTIAKYTARGFQGQHQIDLHLFVPMDKETAWNVSVLKSSTWFPHHSILFESSQGDTFWVALYVKNDEVKLACQNIDISAYKYQSLSTEHLGTIRKSAMNILETAATVLKQLGSYHCVLNNCQVSTHATVCFHVYNRELGNTCTI